MLKNVIPTETVTINQLFERYFDTCPNIVSLDIEGNEMEILEATDLTKFRPQIWCVETLLYTRKPGAPQDRRVTEFMEKHGYYHYADTYINSIYVDWDAYCRA